MLDNMSITSKVPIKEKKGNAMGELAGQVALVTGGGRGLGRAISLALAAEGAKVAIDDIFRDEEGVSAAEHTVADIVAAGGEGLALHEDVTTPEGAEAMVERTWEKYGRLDNLIMCAGNMARESIEDLSVDKWDSLINLHLRGHFLASKYAVPRMKERDSGSIIALSSRSAFFQVPASKLESREGRKQPSTAYSAAKAGILGLATTLAVELWDTGIRVNSLLPSATTQLFPESKPRMVGGVPPSQSLAPEDVAPTAVFLCSDSAKNISGKIIYVSGGDVIMYGDPLDARGSRMVRKHGRWEPEELAEVIPPLVGL